MAETEAERIAALCSRVLHKNWREGEQRGRHYGFIAPSPGHYDWQWYWDSCFHAIIWRRLDPARSRLELETLLASSQDGFIGHTNFLGKKLNLERAIRYNIASRHAAATSTIQPPVLAWAWSIAIGDPSTEPRIRAHHEWLRAHRDLEGDNLLWLIQPDESGMDASPKFDHVWGRRAQGHRLFPALIHANRRRGFDAHRISADARPVVCEVMTNVLWSLSEQAMGNPSPTPALIARLWNNDAGRFLDEAQSPVSSIEPRDVPFTWDTLAPLALPDLPADIGRRLVQEMSTGTRDTVRRGEILGRRSDTVGRTRRPAGWQRESQQADIAANLPSRWLSIREGPGRCRRTRHPPQSPFVPRSRT